MKNILSAACFCVLLHTACMSQTKSVDVDNDNVNAASLFHSASGMPFVEARFVRLVEGTPYFKNEWLNGFLISENGKRYKGLVKLDLYSNAVHYKDSKEVEFVVELPVKQIIFSSPDTSYLFIQAPFVQPKKSASKNFWYQQLYSDSISLYKYFQKLVSESRPYSSATFEQTIRTAETYWVYYNGTPIEVKKIKDAPSLFGDKKEALSAFLKNHDDKSRSMDERMIAFVKYLNTLVKN